MVNADTILEYLKGLVESKKLIPKETWIEVAFKLNLLRIDEAQLYNKMHQAVAQRKIELKVGDKSVSAVEMEVEAEDIYKFMKDQEEKLYSIDEFIRIAKKAGDITY